MLLCLCLLLDKLKPQFTGGLVTILMVVYPKIVKGERGHDSGGGGDAVTLPCAGNVGSQPVVVQAGLHHCCDSVVIKTTQ